MPLQKIIARPGTNRENTRYTNEAGWYVSEKVRFRQGTPEKIGGWVRISQATFLGICRSLWNWVTLSNSNLLGVGTNLKYYIEQGGAYSDITPIRKTQSVTFAAVTASPFSSTITVTSANHGAITGDFVTFSGAVSLGGNITAAVLNQEYQITSVPTSSTFTFTAKNASTGATVTSNASDVGNGGASSVGAFQVNTGPGVAQVPLIGWGGGAWGGGSWGVTPTVTDPLRIWNANNWGEDLVFGPRAAGLYYWDATGGLSSRGVALNSLGGTVTITIASPGVVTFTVALVEGTAVSFTTTGALPTGLSVGTTYYLRNVSGLTANLSSTPTGSVITTSGTQSGVHSMILEDVPDIQYSLIVSDAYRYLLVFGCNPIDSAVADPMLIRWCSQESLVDWNPAATNTAGSLRLSRGSQIITVQQQRQEILAWTDSALFSIQFLGAPLVWGSQILADNISIAGPNAVAVASSKTYWMGIDKFYIYDGVVKTLNCDLRRYIFNDINLYQNFQIFAGTNEGFNEIWWFYCSESSSTIDRYVVFNYAENNGQGVWYYGTMARTAWSDSGLRQYPQAATYSNNIVDHERGVDDNVSGTPAAINAYIESAEFDIQDGHNLGYVYRVLPDITFDGSETASPAVTMTLIPMMNSGSGYNNPQSNSGSSSASVVRTSTTTIEQFTGQVYVRVRGRQMIFKVESNQLGCTWQLGAPRIDIRQDGRATGQGA
jgi:hypothetical protein